LKSFLRGSIEIEPKIVCADETGKKMTFSPEPIIFNFIEAAIPGRVSTGCDQLDNLLFGGIPENYTVILTSPSCNEREELIKKFLQAGINHGQITFYVTEELGNAKTMQAEKQQSNIYLFMCNPRAEIIAQGAPNIFKLKGVENLTDIEIALTKAFRTLTTARNEPRRACIEIVSDVLLQHHAIVTRKWLSGLLADLKSNGFTTLAVMNPQMHMQEEVQAILGVFEGEIRIFERENGKGLEKILRVRKMYNQKYIETDLILTREKLENE